MVAQGIGNGIPVARDEFPDPCTIAALKQAGQRRHFGIRALHERFRLARHLLVHVALLKIHESRPSLLDFVRRGLHRGEGIFRAQDAVGIFIGGADDLHRVGQLHVFEVAD